MSEDDHVVSSPKKTQPFTIKERKLILSLVNKHHEIIYSKKVDNRTMNEKNQAWEEIHREFVNHKEITQIPRTVQQLKRCLENLRSKAKAGDVASQKLIEWNKKMVANHTDVRDSGFNYSTEMDEDTSSSIEFGDQGIDDDLKAIENDNGTLDEHLSLLASGDISCHHCDCDKKEKAARARILRLEKQQRDIIHRLKIQNLRAKMKRDKELHKLSVHELSLKVENERKRASILEKELSLYS